MRDDESERATLPKSDRKANGRPRIQVDLKQPDLTSADVSAELGIKPGVISYRKDHDPEFGEATRRHGAQQSRENITETITEEATNNSVTRNDVSAEKEKLAMAQVQVAGRVQMDEAIEVRVSEIAQWPKERISGFA